MTQRWIGGLVLVAALLGQALPAQAQGGTHNESSREQWQKVDEIFAAMAVKPGSVVADVGAGGGFFTARLSKAVGASGQVLAVDVGTDALRRLRARVTDDQLTNVKVIEGAVDDPRLPAGSLDAILIVNAYHEMTEYAAMLKGMKAALKPDGRLVIVEPIDDSRRDLSRADQTRQHQISAAFVKEDVKAAGFKQVLFREPFTSRQHDTEWLLVVTPATASDASASLWSSSKDTDWQAADLRIAMDEYLRLKAAGQDILLLDVRDDRSFKNGHMPSAELMAIPELTSASGLARFKKEGRMIVTYCECEAEQTSARAARILRDAGVGKVYALVGGWAEWQKRSGVR